MTGPVGCLSLEVLLVVGLSKKKRELVKEVEEIIDLARVVHAMRCEDPADVADIREDGWDLWVPDNSRAREEVAGHLDVWVLRKQRTPFSDIAQKLNISVDTAKKRFYRAYELTQRTTYDKERWEKRPRQTRLADREECVVIAPT